MVTAAVCAGWEAGAVQAGDEAHIEQVYSRRHGQAAERSWPAVHRQSRNRVQAGKQVYSDADALRWSTQLAEALAYLHSQSPKVTGCWPTGGCLFLLAARCGAGWCALDGGKL